MGWMERLALGHVVRWVWQQRLSNHLPASWQMIVGCGALVGLHIPMSASIISPPFASIVPMLMFSFINATLSSGICICLTEAAIKISSGCFHIKHRRDCCVIRITRQNWVRDRPHEWIITRCILVGFFFLSGFGKFIFLYFMLFFSMKGQITDTQPSSLLLLSCC